jgi:hypothetical protein
MASPIGTITRPYHMQPIRVCKWYKVLATMYAIGSNTATSLRIHVQRIPDALQCRSSRLHVHSMPYAL